MRPVIELVGERRESFGTQRRDTRRLTRTRQRLDGDQHVCT
jgi:hypothetical protein